MQNKFKMAVNQFTRFLRKLPFLPVNTYAFDSHGKRLFKIFLQDREAIKFSEIPKTLLDSIIAVEDKRFYSHFGIDILAIGRALLANVRALGIVQGGSTITQQLVRNLFLTARKSLFRKVIESCIAVIYEMFRSKDEILEDYVNTVYLGESLHGFKNAAKFYFGKKVKHLSLSEVATLTGMIRSPARYSPLNNPVRCDERRRFVLSRMRKKGLLSEENYQRARRQSAVATCQEREPENALYTRDFIKEILQRDFREHYPHRKLIVHSSIDTHVQNAIEETLSEFKDELQCGISFCVLETTTGLIKGMASGAEYRQTQFNSSVHGTVQPGSTLKPHILAHALRSGYSVDDFFESKELEIPIGGRRVWRVHNWQGKYFGMSTLRQALINSDNSVFAQLIQNLDLTELRNLLVNVGIRINTPRISLATGSTRRGVSPLSLAASYTPFFNDGYYWPPRIITKIFTENGEVIYELRKAPIQVIDTVTANKINEILKDVVTYGTAYHPELVRYAGKTGTTDSGSVLCLYDDKLLTSVWVGFNPRKYRSAAEYYEKGVAPKTIFARFLKKLSIRKLFVEPDISVF